jgi:predicted dehydrogenase
MVKKIRYAVVGLGHIAQNAVLPAFEHARENSELAAFVSHSEHKTEELKQKYGVQDWWTYEEYEQCLRSGKIDAVYIALPNDMHKEFTVQACKAGIHVLCEKPMAPTEKDCQAMIDSAESNNVKLMIAYRLHFEEGNLKAIEIVNGGKIGRPRYFTSAFSHQVEPGNIRVKGERSGGPLLDLGVYCINAARYLFQDEPIQASAFTGSTNDKRFADTEEAVSVTLRFPDDRLATFVCSNGASALNWYQVVGTEGDLMVNPAYEYETEIKHILTVGGKSKETTFSKRDQFAPELVYFSDCILNNKEVESSGHEGLADIRIVQAIYESARTGKQVAIEPLRKSNRPSLKQVIVKPAISKPPLVDVQAPSK